MTILVRIPNDIESNAAIKTVLPLPWVADNTTNDPHNEETWTAIMVALIKQFIIKSNQLTDHLIHCKSLDVYVLSDDWFGGDAFARNIFKVDAEGQLGKISAKTLETIMESASELPFQQLSKIDNTDWKCPKTDWLLRKTLHWDGHYPPSPC